MENYNNLYVEIILTEAILQECYDISHFYYFVPNLQKRKARKLTRLMMKYWVSNITFHEWHFGTDVPRKISQSKIKKKVLVMQFSKNTCVFLAVLLLNLICTMFNVISLIKKLLKFENWFPKGSAKILPEIWIKISWSILLIKGVFARSTFSCLISTSPFVFAQLGAEERPPNLTLSILKVKQRSKSADKSKLKNSLLITYIEVH